MIDRGDIKELRHALKMNQRELAEKLGVSVRTIQNYESGGVIPESKYKILASLSNPIAEKISGSIITSGDGNISNTGTIEGGFLNSGGFLSELLKNEGHNTDGSGYTPKQIVATMMAKIESIEKENEELKRDKAILQEFVSVLQEKIDKQQ